MENNPTHLSIKDVEDMVGKKASHVLVRARDILVYFTGGLCADGGLAATICWHIRRW